MAWLAQSRALSGGWMLAIIYYKNKNPE